MSKITLKGGIQGSDKSIWAKKWIDENPENRVRVNNGYEKDYELDYVIGKNAYSEDEDEAVLDKTETDTTKKDDKEYYSKEYREHYNLSESEKNKIVSGKFLYALTNFSLFKKWETYWLEYVGDDTYIGRSDNILNEKVVITPYQLDNYFSETAPSDFEKHLTEWFYGMRTWGLTAYGETCENFCDSQAHKAAKRLLMYALTLNDDDMNENLNLYQILKDCPKGTKLWSPIWGDMVLKEIDDNIPMIVLTVNGFNDITLFPNGTVYNLKESECILFPSKSQRDWSKFKVPVKRFDPKELKPFDRVLVSRGGSKWTPNLFGKIIETPHGTYPIAAVCIALTWEMCIPYNDETKHLLGTTDDCPEYYKWWEE